uniref:Putative f-box only protein 28 n=1 Tax=Xenopsylla cheopis TaxID=163159 RepID=A0A6M2DKY6_XENCH
MVSTRQMTNVGGSSPSSDEAETGTRPPRHNSVITIVTSSLIQNAAVEPSTLSTVVSRPTIKLLDLPQEVIEKILSYVGYKKVSQMRMVCRQMNATCSAILNSTFSRLQTQMLVRFQAIKSKMPRRESARRNHPLACESDIIETLHMRLTLLQMTFGKHIERRHCCFFPGEILDEVYRILHYIRVTQKLARPYKVTDELFDLSTMAMEYFKERIEPALPEIAYFGTDFLDFTGTFAGGSVSKSYLCLSSEQSPVHSHDSSPPHDGCASKQGSPCSPDSHDREIADQRGSSASRRALPRTNMVLRNRIHKIKQGMKKYNSQLTLLRNELRSCKRKTAEQQRQISEQQKQLAEQQKQTLEYATRLDENDKKNEETSRKFSTLLQELNKCKTELQYWKSNSPANPPFCKTCGTNVLSLNSDELKALVNQGVKPEDVGLDFSRDSNDSVFENITKSIEGDSEEDKQKEIFSLTTEHLSSNSAEAKTLKLVEGKVDDQAIDCSVSTGSKYIDPIIASSPKSSKRKIEEIPTTSVGEAVLIKKPRRSLKTRCGKIRAGK